MSTISSTWNITVYKYIIEITRNDIVHSPNIGIKITQKKNKEIIFNTTNKLLFNTNKLNQVQNKNFKNDFNIQIDSKKLKKIW